MPRNGSLSTDVYKIGHIEQYAPGTTESFEAYCTRSDKEFLEAMSFGFQYYPKKYFPNGKFTRAQADEFLEIRSGIMGVPRSRQIGNQMYALADLGYIPLRIRALPEGTIYPSVNCYMTVVNTHPDFHWLPGFLGSLMLKSWYPSLVGTNSYHYWKDINRATRCNTDFLVHDFGYRSDSSDGSAAISGAAHLIPFRGSDTVLAWPFIRDWYGPLPQFVMGSVPATEHAVMCSYGENGEEEAFERILDLYPEGIVSIVSDTYDIYNVCTHILPKFKDRIMNRNGKVVIRPDSGYPPNIICGNPIAMGVPERKGVLRLLAEEFGTVPGEYGKTMLDPHIGVIYGDGWYRPRYQECLQRISDMGFDPANLVVGVGGLLRMGTRDTLGHANKATRIIRNGSPVELMKHPITDPGKNSYKGLVMLVRGADGKLVTRDQVTADQEASDENELKIVFENGKLVKDWTFDEVRENFQRSATAA
jgi:nicotinamide phosphoribosyltransferase